MKKLYSDDMLKKLKDGIPMAVSNVSIPELPSKPNEKKTKKSYSKTTLRRLRNDIPIAILIGDILEIPSKISEGYFRFLCPNCKEFNTATNSETNLGRCFRCAVNYNPIDIVMIVKHFDFKDAVLFLDNLQKV